MGEDPPDYGAKDYWDEEYRSNADGERYDWIVDFSECEARLRQELERVRTASGPGGAEPAERSAQRDALVLHLGSGNSSFPEIFRDRLGCKNQVVTDISELCMEKLQREWEGKVAATAASDPARAEDLEELLYLPGNACDLSSVGGALERRQSGLGGGEGSSSDGTGSTDIVFEKGTLDALNCDDSECGLKILLMLKEVHRVLNPNHGVFFSVSYKPPAHWDIFFKLRCFEWTLDVVPFEPNSKKATGEAENKSSSQDGSEARGQDGPQPKPKRKTLHYGYLLQRNGREMDGALWEQILAEVRADPDEEPSQKWIAEDPRI